MTDKDKMRKNEPLENFQEGQWWIEVLDYFKHQCDDTKRAVAVVHHLLRSVRDFEADAESSSKELEAAKQRILELEENLGHAEMAAEAEAKYANELLAENKALEKKLAEGVCIVANLMQQAVIRTEELTKRETPACYLRIMANELRASASQPTIKE